MKKSLKITKQLVIAQVPNKLKCPNIKYQLRLGLHYRLIIERNKGKRGKQQKIENKIKIKEDSQLTLIKKFQKLPDIKPNKIEHNPINSPKREKPDQDKDGSKIVINKF